MHLFNFNEQNVFHYLTKSNVQNIPICFALDYNQAIGDYGDKQDDYIEKSLINGELKKLVTVFRNSPQISEFCRSIAASGALMFQTHFENPYDNTQSAFTNSEEEKCDLPTLYMYNNDNEMYTSLGKHIDEMVKKLQCKPNKIAIISFDSNIFKDEEIQKLQQITHKKFRLLHFFDKSNFNNQSDVSNFFVLASPYDINGLEFNGVILLGVDEGRIPQTYGISDISHHFVLYSAYNLLYLCSSRAKYQLILLGTKTRGESSCLEYSLANNFLKLENVSKQKS